MRIGEPVRRDTEEPTPRRIPVPIRREPVPVRRTAPEKEPVRREMEPAKKQLSLQEIGIAKGFTIEEIPYSCPYDGRELTMDEGTLTCPKHGVVFHG